MVDAQLPKNSSGTLVIERDNDQDRNDRVAEFNLKKKQKNGSLLLDQLFIEEKF